LSCPTSSSQLLLQCLRSTPLGKLLQHAASAAASSPDVSSATHRPASGGYGGEDDDTVSAAAAGFPPPLPPHLLRPTWAPSYDGVVVHSFKQRMRDYLERMSRYDLLYGVGTAEATNLMFAEKQVQFGMDAQQRNRLIFDLVATAYGGAGQGRAGEREIFSAIVTTYSDWQSTYRHPVGIRDSCVEAMTDALFTAPIIETADYHSSLNAKSWMYVFDYQSKSSPFKQVSAKQRMTERNSLSSLIDDAFFLASRLSSW
jgi:hypothetical protein